MVACFALQHAERIIGTHRQGRVANARLFGRRLFQEFGFITLGFGPSLIHP